MHNYANDIVVQVKDACTQGQVSQPILISESGRAIAAHQSVLVFDVLHSSSVAIPKINKPVTEAPLVINNFWQTY